MPHVALLPLLEAPPGSRVLPLEALHVASAHMPAPGPAPSSLLPHLDPQSGKCRGQVSHQSRNGGTNINTTVSGNNVRIDMPATLGVSKYDDLEEVVRTGRTIDKSYMPAFAMLRLNNVGNTAYSCDSHGYTGNNPTFYAIGGMTIAFDLDQVAGHPFEIQDPTSTAYNNGLYHVDIIGNVTTGVNAQGKDGGTLYWEVPETISGNYRYQCTLHPAMVGAITIKRISVI